MGNSLAYTSKSTSGRRLETMKTAAIATRNVPAVVTRIEIPAFILKLFRRSTINERALDEARHKSNALACNSQYRQIL
jgi:hypothetical protein